MKSLAEFLNELYVCKNEKITPWGTVIFLERKSKGKSWIECWASELIKYGGSDCRADFGPLCCIQVWNGDPSACDSSEKERIPLHKLYLVHCDSYLDVLADGHLWYSEPYDNERRRSYLDAFQTAESGKKPQLLDDGLFVQIPKEFEGKRVIQLSFVGGEGVRVYTQNGKEIPCKIHTPLSSVRWNNP